VAFLQQSGFEIDLPQGWEGRIFTRRPGSTPQPESVPAPQGTPGPQGAPVPPAGPAEVFRPVLHAANFGLPASVGDYGGGAVELMGNGHVFVAVIDFGTDAAGTALFAHRGIPRPLRTDQFDPLSLQRTLPGQSGIQRFFTQAGRGFCLYVVLGAHLWRPRLVPLTNAALRTLRIT
jgi:hypothetical protein